MKHDIRTVNPDDTVMKAVKIMNKHHIGSVIVSKNWVARGIITERDVLKKIVAKRKNPSKVLCRNIMSKPLITIESAKEVTEAVKMMVKNKIKRLAVTRKGRIVGMLTVSDVLRSGHRVEDAVLAELAKFFPLEKTGYGE
jgi:CBS domain-containing protein